MAVGVAVVATLCLAVILLAGPPAREASRVPDAEGAAQSTVQKRELAKDRAQDDEQDGSKAIHSAARMYAKNFGVSLKEADRRLKMQGDALPTNLERKLKKEKPDSYAGLWLRHEPDYGITVALAGDSEAAAERVRGFVDGTQWEGTVNIKRVEASMVELNAARAKAEGMMDRLGIQYDSGDNILKNRMEIYVANKERVLRKLDAAGLEIPRHVVLLEGMSSPDVPE